jgi:hypothetical protein
MARTQGTFQQVYEAAREFMADGHGKPLDPVVRVEGETWMLESRMNSAEGCSFEISLDDFVSYWWEGLNDPEWTPSQFDIDEFIANCTPQE